MASSVSRLEGVKMVSRDFTVQAAIGDALNRDR